MLLYYSALPTLDEMMPYRWFDTAGLGRHDRRKKVG